MKRGNIAIEAPAPKEAGSAAPSKGAPSLVGKAAAATGSLGAIAVSSDTVTTSSPLAFLALSAGTKTSSAFLFREGSSSATTGGTLATDGWPIFLAPVLQFNRVSKVIRVQRKTNVGEQTHLATGMKRSPVRMPAGFSSSGPSQRLRAISRTSCAQDTDGFFVVEAAAEASETFSAGASLG